MKTYEEGIQKHIYECQKHRLDAPETVIASARVLREYAKAHHDEVLLAHADYYMASSYYVLNDQSTCMLFLNWAIQGFENTSNYEDLGFCHNLMGLVKTRAGDSAGAISAYLNALRLAEEHQLNMLGAYVQINCADLCMELQNESEALYHLQLGETYLDRCPENARQPFSYAVAASESALICYNLKNKEEFERQTMILKRIVDNHPELSDNINVQLLHIIMDDSSDPSERNRQIEKMWSHLRKDPEFLDYHNEIIRFMNILFDTHNYKILDELITQVDEAMSGTLSPGMRTAISSFCIHYYEQIGARDRYVQELMKYYQSAERLNHERENSIVSLLRASTDLAVSRRTNQILEKAAETDPLTSHPNRRYFNTKADQYFEEAKNSGHSLGFEMLDIDSFKQVNDQYGHTAGDDALITIAKALKTLDGSGIWSARYGGDEFIVLFYDKSDEEIRQYMDSLSAEIHDLQKQNSLPSFTISQGAVNLVPHPLNKVWDFYYAADAALYQIKRHGKNGTLLIHEISDLNNPDIEFALDRSRK